MSVLPGWFPAAAAAARPPTGLQLGFFAASFSGAATIALPAAINAGDLIVLIDRALGSLAAPGLVVPAGFTALASFTGTNSLILLRLTVSARIAAGGEGGTAITGQNGNTDNRKVALVIRPVSGAIASVSAHDAALEGFTSADPPAGTILAGAVTPPLIALAVYGASNATSLQAAAKTFTPSEDGTVPDPAATANLIYVKYKIHNAAPADIGIDLPDVASDNILAGLYIQAAKA